MRTGIIALLLLTACTNINTIGTGNTIDFDGMRDGWHKKNPQDDCGQGQDS